MGENLPGGDWVPTTCTLPTVDRPLRRAELDDMFATDVTSMAPPSPGRLRFELRTDPDAVARAARLAVKETGCCSFFGFELAITAGRASMTVTARPAHEPVLEALAARARATMGAGS
jgi:hypothetical protein